MILQKIKDFVKGNLADIILVIGIILISLLSFAAGFIVAKQQEKEPLILEEITSYEKENNNNWSGDLRAVSGLETG